MSRNECQGHGHSLNHEDITSLNNVRIKTEFKNIGMQTSSTALCIKGNNSDTFSWHFLGYSQLSVISQILVNGWPDLC